MPGKMLPQLNAILWIFVILFTIIMMVFISEYIMYSLGWHEVKDGEALAKIIFAIPTIAAGAIAAALGVKMDGSPAGVAGQAEPGVAGPDLAGVAGKAEPDPAGVAGKAEPDPAGVAGKAEPDPAGVAGKAVPDKSPAKIKIRFLGMELNVRWSLPKVGAVGLTWAILTGLVAWIFGFAPPVITSDPNMTAPAGKEFTTTIVATNSPTSYRIAAEPPAAEPPKWLYIDTVQGKIFGSPPSVTRASPVKFKLEASNAGGTGSTTATITLLPAPPEIRGLTSTSTQVGETFNSQIVATNTPTSYSAMGLPDWLKVEPTSGKISGRPSVAGVITVNLGASNDGGPGLSFTATITVRSLPPKISGLTSTTGQMGRVFNSQILATNSPTSYSGTGLPEWLNVNSATGRIFGTPTVAGVSTVSLEASNDGGPSPSATATITVKPLPPEISSASPPKVNVDATFTYQITASNAPTSYSATGLPAGLTVDTVNGLIHGTPRNAGDTSVNLEAINAGGIGATTVTITVLPPPPGITGISSTTTRVGKTFSSQIEATNSPTSYNATGLPDWLKVDPASGMITGTPMRAGSYKVDLEARNDGGKGSTTATIVVFPPPPVITGLSSTITQVGRNFSGRIEATNSPTSYNATGLPDWLKVDPATGEVAGSPTVAGVSTVNLEATNAGGTGSTTATITVHPAPPVITSSNITTGQVGAPFHYLIIASNAPTSYSAAGLPAGLTMDTAHGVISGLPTAAGASAVILEATNAGGTGSTTATITVLPPLPAVKSATTCTGRVNDKFSFQIKASDANGYYIVSPMPEGLNLELDPDSGVLSGALRVPGKYVIKLLVKGIGGSTACDLTLSVDRPLKTFVPDAGSWLGDANWDPPGSPRENDGYDVAIPKGHIANLSLSDIHSSHLIEDHDGGKFVHIGHMVVDGTLSVVNDDRNGGDAVQIEWDEGDVDSVQKWSGTGSIEFSGPLVYICGPRDDGRRLEIQPNITIDGTVVEFFDGDATRDGVPGFQQKRNTTVSVLKSTTLNIKNSGWLFMFPKFENRGSLICVGTAYPGKHAQVKLLNDWQNIDGGSISCTYTDFVLYGNFKTPSGVRLNAESAATIFGHMDNHDAILSRPFIIDPRQWTIGKGGGADLGWGVLTNGTIQGGYIKFTDGIGWSDLATLQASGQLQDVQLTGQKGSR